MAITGSASSRVSHQPRPKLYFRHLRWLFLASFSAYHSVQAGPQIHLSQIASLTAPRMGDPALDIPIEQQLLFIKYREVLLACQHANGEGSCPDLGVNRSIDRDPVVDLDVLLDFIRIYEEGVVHPRILELKPASLYAVCQTLHRHPPPPEFVSGQPLRLNAELLSGKPAQITILTELMRGGAGSPARPAAAPRHFIDFEVPTPNSSAGFSQKAVLEPSTGRSWTRIGLPEGAPASVRRELARQSRFMEELIQLGPTAGLRPGFSVNHQAFYQEYAPTSLAHSGVYQPLPFEKAQQDPQKVAELLQVFSQIANGTQALNKMGIIHGEINPRTIGLRLGQPGKPIRATLALQDTSFHKNLTQEDQRVDVRDGDRLYAPNEIKSAFNTAEYIHHKPGYEEKRDVFSLGLSVAQYLRPELVNSLLECGKINPYDTMSYNNCRYREQRILNMRRPSESQYHDSLSKLLALSLNNQPELRPTIDEFAQKIDRLARQAVAMEGLKAPVNLTSRLGSEYRSLAHFKDCTPEQAVEALRFKAPGSFVVHPDRVKLIFHGLGITYVDQSGRVQHQIVK